MSRAHDGGAGRGGLRETRQRLVRSYKRIAGVFARSLQLRIVVLTSVLTIIAIFGVGTYMSKQIARGLYEAKLSSASAQTVGYGQELGALSGIDDTDQLLDSLNTQLRSMVSRSPMALRSINLAPVGRRDDGVESISTSPYGEEPVRTADLPADFRSRVHDSTDGQQLYQPIALPGAERSPGLVIAQKVMIPAAGQFELYVVADLQDEQNTLEFVQRALLVAALVLVVLVGAISWVVTRMVVTPVRQGADVARRIADGDLDQRMPVIGHDEISTLAQSFNDMAESLQDQILRMEQLTTLQQQFVSDVSHELRTPLTTIRIAADMIYDDRDTFDEATRRSAELLESQVARFENLLADLLEISRYDAGAAALNTTSADLTDVVRGVVESVGVLAARSGSQLGLRAPSQPVMAQIDRIRVTRVVRNLVVNAIEHGEGNPIEVYVGSNAEAVAVSVRDHGVGLNDEQVQHVFDRFWRADPSRKRTLGGSGLGLAISLEDAHLHNGWLQAWGRVGEGSCFRLTVPRRQGEDIVSSPLPLPPADALISGAALVAGPATSDGSVRVQTGSIPIVVELDQAPGTPPAAEGDRS